MCLFLDFKFYLNNFGTLFLSFLSFHFSSFFFLVRHLMSIFIESVEFLVRRWLPFVFYKNRLMVMQHHNCRRKKSTDILSDVSNYLCSLIMRIIISQKQRSDSNIFLHLRTPLIFFLMLKGNENCSSLNVTLFSQCFIILQIDLFYLILVILSLVNRLGKYKLLYS